MFNNQIQNTMKTQIEAVLAKELPGFYTNVSECSILRTPFIHIRIAAKDYNINGVRDQKPQSVGLSLDLNDLELVTQSFGCSYGGRIYRNPDKTHPRECFLAMVGVKVPFRQPQRTEKAVLAAIERFCRNYKQTLIDNLEVLRYQDIVDYKSLLNL